MLLFRHYASFFSLRCGRRGTLTCHFVLGDDSCILLLEFNADRGKRSYNALIQEERRYLLDRFFEHFYVSPYLSRTKEYQGVAAPYFYARAEKKRAPGFVTLTHLAESQVKEGRFLVNGDHTLLSRA